MSYMNRKLLPLGVVLGSITALAACGGDSADSSADGGDGESYRVAYVARAQVDSFAAWLANEMQDEAANYDDISLDVFDGQASDEIENTQIENAIANGYDAIRSEERRVGKECLL